MSAYCVLRALPMLAVAVAACAADTAGPELPGSLTIVVSDTMLLRGETVRLDARALDVRGQPIPGARIEWSTLDPHVVALEEVRVRGRTTGVGRVVARAGTLADTVRFRVRAANPPLGGMMGELRTPAGVTPVSWTVFASFSDVLTTTEGDVLILEARRRDLGTPSRDTSIAFFLRGAPTHAERDIGVFPLDGRVPVAEPVALLVVGDWEEVWASIAVGTLSFTTAELPPAAGWEPGRVDGLAALRLVRLERSPGGIRYSSDTLTFAGEFRSRLQHRLRAHVTTTLTGGPVEGTAVRTRGVSSDDDLGGIMVWWNADFDDLPGQGSAWEASQAIRLHAPAAGTFPIHAVTPRMLEEAEHWPTAFSLLGYRDDERLALSTGGVLTIARYVPATEMYYGEIHGSIESDQELWLDMDTRSGELVRSRATFAVPVGPLGAIPAIAGSERPGSTASRALRVLGLPAPEDESGTSAASPSVRDAWPHIRPPR